ncbi:MAG: MNIO family bufferin maturase [Devosia sp.]
MATIMSRTPNASNAAGIGLRLQHIAEVAATRPPVAWLEIHPENFIANPHAAELLQDLATAYPISVHSVGVSIGSAGGVDRRHLQRVKALIDRIDPFLVSGHLAWSTHEGDYLNDLLPLPYDRESLGILARHVDEVQQALGRPYHVENPSNYLGFGGSTMTEVEFLTELVARTGCRLLCDVSNIHVSGANLGYDPYAYVDGLPAEAIGELHLGGFVIEDEDGAAPAQVLIDTHSRPIDDHAWDLHAHALRRFGPRPTLIEWDNELPSFSTLLGEAARAEAVAAGVFAESMRHAG